MKKGMIALSLALVVGLFSTFGFADGSLDRIDPYEDSMKEHFRPWGEDIVQYEEDAIREAGERNRLKEEQAKTGEEDYKYKFNRNTYYNYGHCSNRFSLNS